MLNIIVPLCRLASIVFGFIAVYYWYKASTAKVTDRDNPHNPGIELRDNPDNEGHRLLYVSTVKEQSRLNAIAAIYTGLAVLFQALASMIG
jgi:hypothetical protein